MVRSRFDESAPLSERSWLSVLGLLLVAAALFVAGGPLGVLAALAIAASWLVLSGPFVVASGHLIALGVVGGGLPSWFLLLLELGLLAVLVGPSLPDDDWLRTAALTAALAAGLVGVGLVGWARWRPRWLLALGFVLLVAAALYTVHRLTVVRLERSGVEPLR